MIPTIRFLISGACIYLAIGLMVLLFVVSIAGPFDNFRDYVQMVLLWPFWLLMFIGFALSV